MKKIYFCNTTINAAVSYTFISLMAAVVVVVVSGTNAFQPSNNKNVKPTTPPSSKRQRGNGPALFKTKGTTTTTPLFGISSSSSSSDTTTDTTESLTTTATINNNNDDDDDDDDTSQQQQQSNDLIIKAPIFDEVCETTGVTLTRFMNEVAMLNPSMQELTILFGAIDTACKAISNLIKRSQLPTSETLGYYNAAGEEEFNTKNISGESQKKLDVLTNDLLKRALRFTGRLGVLASEEEDVPVDLLGTNSNGSSSPSRGEILIEEGDRYVAVFDPLDGSSNVDAGIPTGTIIGIYEHDELCDIDPNCIGDDCSEQEANCLANTLQPGTNLVAAAYCLYSSSTILMLTLGNGVYMFTLDESIGEFILSKPNVRIPDDGNIYSFNEANFDKWDKPLQQVLQKWRDGGSGSNSSSRQQYSSRYIGSMVADVHRTLLYGGVFGYPGDKNNPNGKLRLLYEGAPMSFIMEQAGGISTTGRQRVMEIIPEIVHQRVPVIMGSKNSIQEIIDAYANGDN